MASIVMPEESYSCTICGDKSKGYHFDAITCESCKSFFRRNALNVDKFKCYLGGNCVINIKSRTECRKCRLDKCFAVGMKTNLFYSTKVLQIRRNVIKNNQNFTNNSSMNSESIVDSTPGLCSPQSVSDFIDNMFSEVSLSSEMSDNSCETNTCELSQSVVPIVRPISDYSNTFNELEGNRLTELLSALKYTANPVVNAVDYLTLDCVNTARDISFNRWENQVKLLTAIVLFNPNRPNLINKHMIKLQQNIYIYLLQRYLHMKCGSEFLARGKLHRLVDNLTYLNVINTTIAYYSLYGPDIIPGTKYPLTIVCGDKSKGRHFDAITCQSCKCFFRRYALKKVDHFKCHLGGNCVLNMMTRTECKKCRLDKCFAVGMKTTLFYSEQELQFRRDIIKNYRKRKLNENSSINSDTIEDSTPVIPIMRPISDYSNTFNELEGNRLTELLDALKYVSNPKTKSNNSVYNVKLDLYRPNDYAYSNQLKFLGNIGLDWDSDTLIIDLLTAIILFNPNRPNLLNKNMIKLQQNIFIHLLQRYLQMKCGSKLLADGRVDRLVDNLKYLNQINTGITDHIYIKEFDISAKYPVFREICDRSEIDITTIAKATVNMADASHHFDAITCESCKSFFRRNALKIPDHFKCYLGNDCVINIETRNKCKKCRLDKCFAAGMKTRVNSRLDSWFMFAAIVSLSPEMSDNAYELSQSVVPIVRPISDYSNTFNELEGNRLTELLNALKYTANPVANAVDYITLDCVERAMDILYVKWETQFKHLTAITLFNPNRPNLINKHMIKLQQNIVGPNGHPTASRRPQRRPELIAVNSSGVSDHSSYDRIVGSGDIVLKRMVSGLMATFLADSLSISASLTCGNSTSVCAFGDTRWPIVWTQ
ncbi:unnamed protein product [Medioppia subpectinata]|uniref:Nuclear receptor domain-containing protein n=1 Tax=Medioppia subpectinata TaxID=1979941 RepID=A0A7R9KAY2_9ACAR|nr:unnamed protein product [Medioppia subpectinata]CAG2100067.1 unnamed protein product [Medioppia subpectinata]